MSSAVPYEGLPGCMSEHSTTPWRVQASTSTVFEQVVRMRDAGVAVLLVEQNARRALESADIGCVLDLGRVHITGPAPELLADPQLSELYLGGRPAERSLSQNG